MATADSTTSNPNTDSDSDTNENPNPNSTTTTDTSGTLVPALSSSPAVCIVSSVGDSAAGAFMGSVFGYVKMTNVPEIPTVLLGGDENTTGGLPPIGSVAQDGVTNVTTQGSTALPTNMTSMVGPIGVGVATPVAPIVGTTDPLIGHVTSVILGEKPEKFSGTDFKRWQQKMQFYLITCGLAKYLTEVCPTISADESDLSTIATVQAWMYGDYLCKNHVLNGMVNSLYGVYCEIPTSKNLWEALHKRYNTENAGTKKFLVGRFLDFKMVDSKSIISQVEELQLLLHEIEAEGMNISETFQVATVIEKLPLGWSDYKNRLKHKRKEMTMKDLSLHLRIEEDSMKKSEKLPRVPKANVVETSKPKFDGKRKQDYQAEGKKSQKFQGNCYVCDKPGHKAKDCMKRPNNGKGKGKPAKQAYLTEQEGEEDDEMLTAVVSQVNLIANTKDWYVDIGAIAHICIDKNLFTSYEKKNDGEKIYMTNSNTVTVEGTGKVILKFTSGKFLTLMNVLHVPEIGKNMISVPILIKKGFKMVFESDKFIIRKGEMYVGKGYASDGLFKASVVVIDEKS